MRRLDGITDSMDMSLSKLGVGDGHGGLVHGVTGSWTWLSDWTELKALKLLEENKGVNLRDFKLGNRFLDLMPQAQEQNKK